MYAVVTANFLFAVIVLMLGVIILLTTFKEPQRVEVHITTMGIVVGNTFYPYKDVKDFSIVYQPPQTKLLYVGLSSLLHPLLSIPLEEMDPNQVRERILSYALENLERKEESLTDQLRRLYKL